MFRSKKQRWVAATVAVAVTAVILAGCAGGSATPASSQALVTDKSKISGDITFSTWWAYADQALIDGFKTEYPNVNVKLDFTAIDGYPTKLQAAASSGTLPDVFAVQAAPLTALAGAHQLLDLKDALATPAYDIDGNWGDTFNSSLVSGANAAIAASEPNGEIYGLPFNAISVASIYNQDIFSQVGITPPTSFAQLLSNCTALKSAGYIPMSLTGAVWANWWTYLAWDQTMADDKAADFSVTNPDYVKGFEIVKQMADAGCWDPSQITTDIAGETSLFLQSKTAQFVSVPENFLQSVASGAKFKLGTYVLPALDGKAPNHTLGGGAANVIAVSANSQNPSAAVAFAKYLTSKGVQTELATTQYTIPSLNIDVSSSSPLMAAYLTAAGNGFTDSTKYMPTFSTAGSTTFNTEVLPNLFLGKISPTDAANATKDLFDAAQ